MLEAAISEDDRVHPGAYPETTRTGAAMYICAMADLAEQWPAGRSALTWT